MRTRQSVYTELRHSIANTSVYNIKCFSTHVKGGDCWYGFDYRVTNTLNHSSFLNDICREEHVWKPSHSSAKQIDNAK